MGQQASKANDNARIQSQHAAEIYYIGVNHGIDRIGLKQGTQARLGAGMKIGLVSVVDGQDGGPPTIVIATKDDSEHDFALHPGDTFPLGDQTWKLDHVELSSGHGLTPVFVRIG